MTETINGHQNGQQNGHQNGHQNAAMNGDQNGTADGPKHGALDGPATGALNGHAPNFKSRAFLLEHLQSSMAFFDPERCMDPAGGFFHFFAEDGSVYDRTTRVLVTEARFIFSYAVAYQHLKEEKYAEAVRHGVQFLRGPLRNHTNGAYHWVLENGVPTDSKIYTYALAFVLLAYSKAVSCGVDEAREYMAETFDLMEKHLWEPAHGLYAEEADAQWVVSPYRSESGNLHTCEALIAAYEATKDKRYLDRAVLVADNICNRQAGLAKGLVWEHYFEDWTADMAFNNAADALTIFRPWGYQPGHQVEWARLLLTLNRYAPAIWFVAKARYLFDIAVQQAWDPEHGGLAYSFDPSGAVCDWDKIFWVQVESIGTAAMLGVQTGQDAYWATYEKLWSYSWKHFVDHQHGSWFRRSNRENAPYFREKTKPKLCVDPDYHIAGALAGALSMMPP
jgi:mannose/cellobiose epimerase-like protein (N-acyl-D-glucosamine 2-epimerase family)